MDGSDLRLRQEKAPAKVLVIGVSGSGKTTLAQEISRRLNLPFLPTDPLYWGPNWQPVPVAQVMESVERHLAHEGWVLDGNFEDQHEQIWSRADTIIWLDYNLATILSRVTWRNVKWFLRGDVVWSQQRMTLSRAISGIRHSLRSYGRKKRLYRDLLSRMPDVCVLRFRSPRETSAWLKTLS